MNRMTTLAWTPTALNLPGLTPFSPAELDPGWLARQLPADSISLGQRIPAVAGYRPEWLRDDSRFLENLLAGDPQLLDRFYLVLHLLRALDPRLARAFAHSLRRGLEGAGDVRLDLQLEIQRQTTVVRVQTDSVELFASVERIQIRASFRLETSSVQSGEAPIVLDLDRHGVRARGLPQESLPQTFAPVQWTGLEDLLQAWQRNPSPRKDDDAAPAEDTRVAGEETDELSEPAYPRLASARPTGGGAEAPRGKA